MRSHSLTERLRALIESHRMPKAGRLPLAPTPRARHDIAGDATRTSWARRRTRERTAARQVNRRMKEWQ